MADATVGNQIIAASGGAGRQDLVFLHCLAGLVAQGIDGSGLAGQFLMADATVGNHIIAASGGAGRQDLIFLHCLAGLVALGRNGNGLTAQLCLADGAVDNALVSTAQDAGAFGCILRNGGAGLVAQSIDGLGGGGENFTAQRTMDDQVVGTGFGTVGFLGDDLLCLTGHMLGGLDHIGGGVDQQAVSALGIDTVGVDLVDAGLLILAQRNSYAPLTLLVDLGFEPLQISLVVCVGPNCHTDIAQAGGLAGGDGHQGVVGIYGHEQSQTVADQLAALVEHVSLAIDHMAAGCQVAVGISVVSFAIHVEPAGLHGLIHPVVEPVVVLVAEEAAQQVAVVVVEGVLAVVDGDDDGLVGHAVHHIIEYLGIAAAGNEVTVAVGAVPGILGCAVCGPIVSNAAALYPLVDLGTAGTGMAIGGSVDQIRPVVVAGVVEVAAQQLAVRCEVIVSTLGLCFCVGHDVGAGVHSAGTGIEVIPVAVQQVPAQRQDTVIVEVSLAVGLGDEAGEAANQLAVFEEQLNFVDLHSAMEAVAVGVKAVTVIAHAHPVVLHQNAESCVMGLAVALEQAVVLMLADTDTILAEVIPEAVNFLDTGVVLAIDVVHIAAFCTDPAVLDGIDQGVGVFEGLISTLEAAALFGGTAANNLGILEGQEAVFLLVGFLGSEGVQCVCTQEDVVVDLAGVDGNQTVLGIPCCICLGSQLDAADHAQRISTLSRDGLGLVLPVHGDGQAVGCRIEDDVLGGILHNEVLANDLHIAVIHIKVLVEVDGSTDLGQDTDTFCQLEHEVPGGSVGIVSAGQHVGQVLQLFGHGDLAHIQREGVGGDHRFAQLIHLIDVIIIRCGVGNLTVPCQAAVAAGSHVKVEGHFALVIQGDLDRAGLGAVSGQRCGDGNDLQTGFLVGDEVEAIEGTGSSVTQGEYHVAFVDGDGLALVLCLDRQFGLCVEDSVDVFSGEVDRIGVHDLDLLAADHSVTDHQIDGHGTQADTGQSTVLSDGSLGGVVHCPVSAFGEFGLVTGGADALGGNRDHRVGSQVVVSALDHCMVKCSGAGSSRDHHQRGSNRSCKTVGGFADHTQGILALRLGNVSGRAAAVQVDCIVTASLQHDLCDLLHTAAAGHRLLTAVQDHEDDLAASGDTNCGTGCAVGVVVVGTGDRDLTVNHQHGAEAADSFQNAVLHLVVLSGSANNSRAVLQDTEEAVAVGLMVFHAAHNQNTAGLAGRHIKAVGVDRGDDIVIFNVQGAVGIAVLILCSLSLILNTGHLPALSGIIFVVVCVDVDVVTVDVGSCDVVDDLLVIGSGRLLDLLSDTRCQHGEVALEDSVVLVVRHFHVVAAQLAEVICESVAAGDSHLGNIISLKVSGAFQGGNDLVADVLTVNSIADCVTGADAVQTVLQEELCTIFIGQILGEISLHDLGQVTGFVALLLQRVHHVEAIQVAVHIAVAELIVLTGDIVVQVLLTDLLGHFLDGGVVAIFIGSVDIMAVGGSQQVDQVACPASHVGVILAEVIVVSDVHGAEHMTEVNTVAIGQHKFVDILQCGDLDHVFHIVKLSIVLVLTLGDILCEVRIFVTGHDVPGTGIVTVNTGTDVFDHDAQRILAGILSNIISSPLLQDSQAFDELIVSFDRRHGQCRDLHHGGVVTVQAALISFPTGVTEGRLLGRHLQEHMASCRNDLHTAQNRLAYRTLNACLMAGFFTHCGEFFDLHADMLQLFAFSLTTTVQAGGRCQTSSLAHVVAQRLAFGLTAITTADRRLFTSSRCHAVAQRCADNHSHSVADDRTGITLYVVDGCLFTGGSGLNSLGCLLRKAVRQLFAHGHGQSLVDYITVVTLDIIDCCCSTGCCTCQLIRGLFLEAVALCLTNRYGLVFGNSGLTLVTEDVVSSCFCASCCARQLGGSCGGIGVFHRFADRNGLVLSYCITVITLDIVLSCCCTSCYACQLAGSLICIAVALGIAVRNGLVCRHLSTVITLDIIGCCCCTSRCTCQLIGFLCGIAVALGSTNSYNLFSCECVTIITLDIVGGCCCTSCCTCQLAGGLGRVAVRQGVTNAHSLILSHGITVITLDIILCNRNTGRGRCNFIRCLAAEAVALCLTNRYGLALRYRITVITLDIVGGCCCTGCCTCQLAGSLICIAVALGIAVRNGLVCRHLSTVITLDIIGCCVLTISSSCLLVGSLLIEGVAIGCANSNSLSRSYCIAVITLDIVSCSLSTGCFTCRLVGSLFVEAVRQRVAVCYSIRIADSRTVVTLDKVHLGCTAACLACNSTGVLVSKAVRQRITLSVATACALTGSRSCTGSRSHVVAKRRRYRSFLTVFAAKLTCIERIAALFTSRLNDRSDTTVAANRTIQSLGILIALAIQFHNRRMNDCALCLTIRTSSCLGGNLTNYNLRVISHLFGAGFSSAGKGC